MKLDADEHILLTEEDMERIKEICANPPKPTKYMLAALKRYKERYKKLAALKRYKERYKDETKT